MRSIANLEMKIRDARKVVIVHPFTYVNPYSILPPVAAEYLQAGVIETGREAVLLDMRFETDANRTRAWCERRDFRKAVRSWGNRGAASVRMRRRRSARPRSLA